MQLVCGQEVTENTEGPRSFSIQTDADEPALLVLEELGRDLEMQHADGSWTPLTYPGLRLGLWRFRAAPGALLRVTLRPVMHAQAKLRWRLDCRPTSDARLRWIERAQTLSVGVDYLTQGEPDLAAFQALLEAAEADEDRAGALHMLAQAHSRLGDLRAATETYREAHAAWLQADEPVRAGAALLGVSGLLNSQAQFADARLASLQAEALLQGESAAYLSVRARGSVCQVHHYLGELDEAESCLQQVLHRNLSLDELDDWAISALNVSYLARDLGRPPAPETFAAETAAALASPYVQPGSKGQVHFLLAQLYRDNGDLAQAIRHYSTAIAWFQQMTEQRVVRQANALVQVAEIYGQLGMADQAYRLFTDSLALYDPQQAPARVAGALMKLAEIDRTNLLAARGVRWLEMAETIYRHLKLPRELAEARLRRLELQSVAMDPDAARHALQNAPDWGSLSATQHQRRALLELRWATAAGDFAHAQSLAEALDDQPVTLPLRIERARLRARLHAVDGDVNAARESLETEIDELAELANGASTAALAYLSLRAAQGLLEDWTALALAQPTEHSAQRLWDLWQQASPMQGLVPGRRAGSETRFGTQVAAELFGTHKPAAPSDKVRGVLDQIGAAAAAKPERAPLLSLPQMQAQLEADHWLLAIVTAEPASAALWISRDQALLQRLPGRSDILQQIAHLQQSLAHPEVRVSTIDTAALAVSESLFAGAPQAQPPQRLWMLAEERVAGAPLVLLRWPGQSDPLIASTTTGWITRIAGTQRPQPDAAAERRLHAVVASQSGQSGAAGLARLAQAEHEPDLIARAQPQLQQLRSSGDLAQPAALIGALQAPGSWVHLAAHGYAEPGMFGYAGVWLAPAADSDQPQFVSWLDLAELPLQAELAVLNACQLAAGPSATSRSSMSFAGAVSAAGVKQVIAALWPVSDSATGVWVPAFYQALGAQDATPADQALRQAQLALRNSRAFRHPYYWASLAHFQRIDGAAAAPMLGARR